MSGSAFSWSAGGGAPTYNSGFLEGELALSRGEAVFKADGVAGGRCELHFAFSEQKVGIRYLNESLDCGFGYAVFANGWYRRTSRDEPVFSDGDPRGGPPPGEDVAIEQGVAADEAP